MHTEAEKVITAVKKVLCTCALLWCNDIPAARVIRCCQIHSIGSFFIISYTYSETWSGLISSAGGSKGRHFTSQSRVLRWTICSKIFAKSKMLRQCLQYLTQWPNVKNISKEIIWYRCNNILIHFTIYIFYTRLTHHMFLLS